MNRPPPRPEPDAEDRDSRLVDAAWDQLAGARSRQILSPGFGPATPGTSASRLPHLAPPIFFDGYRLLGEIHRGGQGVVYQAIQESTGRKVAIKILGRGPLANQVDQARFDREVELLGRLRHPNVVGIHDRGQAAGHSYYVMDFVPGRALDTHLASGEYDQLHTLRMFQKICEAVGAAHFRGIIHRDLKPANIRIDEDGQPHVLDFGLAKLVAPAGGATPGDVTVAGQFIGSLPWASPEQAAGRVDDIDVRSDVYSLGVMLYQILTGQFPYPVHGSAREVIDHIVHTPPTRPRTVRKGVSDELETIVLKCLAKEPDRRYLSAGELARDLGHYLSGDPIEAKRDSAWYLLRTLVRRHRVAAGIVAAFLLLIATGGAASWVLYGEAQDARQAAAERRLTAEAEGRRATEIQRVLESILKSANPWVAAGADTTILRGIVDEARAVAAQERERQPLFCAGIQETIGRVYCSLRRYDEAEEVLQSSLEIRRERLARPSAMIASSLDALAVLRFEQARLDEAETLAREALDERRQVDGEANLAFASTLGILARVEQGRKHYPQSETLYRRALDTYLHRNGSVGMRAFMASELAEVLREQQRPQEAADVLADALHLAEDHLGEYDPVLAYVHERIAALLSYQYELPTALEHISQALRVYRMCFPGPHLRTAGALNTMGTLLVRMERYAEAEPFLLESIGIRRALLGPNTREVDASLCGLGMARKNLGRLDEAQAAYDEALAYAREDHDERLIAYILNNLAALCKARGQVDESEPYDIEALAIRRRIYGELNADVAQSLHNLADTAENRGDFPGAVDLFAQALAIQRKTLGEENVIVGKTLGGMGRCMYKMNHPQTEQTLAEAMRVLSKHYPDDDPKVFMARYHHACALVWLTRYAEAEPELLQCERQTQVGTKDGIAHRNLVLLLRDLYRLWDKPDQAAEWGAKLKQEPERAK